MSNNNEYDHIVIGEDFHLVEVGNLSMDDYVLSINRNYMPFMLEKQLSNYYDDISSAIFLSNYLDKTVGGSISGYLDILGPTFISGSMNVDGNTSISGDLSIDSHNFAILSGNFIQTTDFSKTQNYSSKNSFLQAEYASYYGIAYTGTRGYCILDVLSSENKLKLSGDISLLADICNGLKTTGNISQIPLSSSLALKIVLGKPITNDRVGSNTNLSSARFSIALSSQSSPSYFTLKSVDVENGLVEFNEPLSAYKIQLYDNQEISFFEECWINDDNALYLAGFPEVGNAIIKNFYGNHAEGGSTRAIGKYTHVEGRDTIANMRYAHAEGAHTIADEMATHAEGFMTVASGRYSHSEGFQTLAAGSQSHVEGQANVAYGNDSHAEGYHSTSYGTNSHAEGSGSYAQGNNSHAEGSGDQLQITVGRSNTHTLFSSNTSLSSYAEDDAIVIIDNDYTLSSQLTSYELNAENNRISVYLKDDIPQLANKPTLVQAAFFKKYAIGNSSHAEGRNAHAANMASHAEGFSTYASGIASHASGIKAKAIDDYSFAWNGVSSTSYHSNGEGTFNINPKYGADGFYIGDEDLNECIEDIHLSSYMHFKVDITSEHNKLGIYSALREDQTKPIVINWGDGCISSFDDDSLNKVVHEYSNEGTFYAKLKNAINVVVGASTSVPDWLTISCHNGYILKEATLNNGVETIINSAFRQCSALNNVVIPNTVKYIGMYAFNRCPSLSNVSIPNSVVSIDNYAFAINGLLSIEIPDGIEKIGTGAFSTSLNMTDVMIGNRVSSIGNNAFTACNQLSSIIFTDRLLSEIPTGSKWNAPASATISIQNTAKYATGNFISSIAKALDLAKNDAELSSAIKSSLQAYLQ